MPRAFVLSSRTRWQRPTAVPPSLRPNSARLKSEPIPMEAIRYIVDTLLWLLELAFVLRLLFQLVRADFRDPMADAIVRVTNWLILPLRRVAPPVGKVDTATVIAVLLAACARTFVIMAMAGMGTGDLFVFLRI